MSCPSLPGDAVLSSMDTTYGSEVVMSCADSANERIPGAPVGASLTLTCEANRTWSGGWNGGENVTEGCVGKSSSVSDSVVVQAGPVINN